MTQSTVDTETSGRVPWHLWLMGVISLLWNGFGAYDYVMTHLRDPGYLEMFPPEMIPMLDAFPTWATAAWAIGVWASVGGSVLLLLRSRYAVHAFALSLAGLAVGTIYQMSIDVPEVLQTTMMAVMNLAIWAGALIFLAYAMAMRRRGVLR